MFIPRPFCPARITVKPTGGEGERQAGATPIFPKKTEEPKFVIDGRFSRAPLLIKGQWRERSVRHFLDFRLFPVLRCDNEASPAVLRLADDFGHGRERGVEPVHGGGVAAVHLRLDPP